MHTPAVPLLLAGRPIVTAQLSFPLNPFTLQNEAAISEATADIADEAVAVASDFINSGSPLPPIQRSEILKRVAEHLQTEKAHLAGLITAECGKVIREAESEVDRATQTFLAAAKVADRIVDKSLPLASLSSGDATVATIRRFPVGPILAITPFNFPVNLVAHKIAPAIAAGCPVVVKPSPHTPRCALALARLCGESGLPGSMISVLPAADAVAERLVRDDRLKMLTFTGSARVGWYLKSLCGKKRVCLELGGNAAVIVHSDADLSYAAARCARGAVSNNGQSCISVQRIYVHDSIYDNFASAILAEFDSFKVGDPTDYRMDVGPLIRESEARRVEAWVAAAAASAARILCGGKRSGSFFVPTLIASEDQTLTVSCEEVFAPVAVLSRYASFEEALSLVNNSRYGLQAGVFTNDGTKALQAFEALQVGAVLINEVPTWRDDRVPYGGTKDSGIGREGPLYAYLEMTEPRLLIKASAN